MIKIENLEVLGFNAALRGMRNPKNSWSKSDSNGSDIGPNDFKLAMQLALAGTDHAKFLRDIVVMMDITAPLYWWKEFDTYKVGVHYDDDYGYDDFSEMVFRDPDLVTNSCSTMHKILSKPITMSDFSVEYLLTMKDLDDRGKAFTRVPRFYFKELVETIETFRELAVETNDALYWLQVIQMLPSSYNQKRTVKINFSTLRSMFRARQNHKLPEWRDFCSTMLRSLPGSKIIAAQQLIVKGGKTL